MFTIEVYRHRFGGFYAVLTVREAVCAQDAVRVAEVAFTTSTDPWSTEALATREAMQRYRAWRDEQMRAAGGMQ